MICLKLPIKSLYLIILLERFSIECREYFAFALIFRYYAL